MVVNAEDDFRTFTHIDGVQIRARLVEAEGDTMHIVSEDGRAIALPLNGLSAEDRSWINSQLIAINRVNELAKIIAGTGMKNPKNYYAWPISMMAADLETYGESDQFGGYGRTRDILITGNRFENCDKRIAAGIYARNEYPLLPKNILVYKNVFVGMGEGSAFDFIADDPSGGLRKELRETENIFQP